MIVLPRSWRLLLAATVCLVHAQEQPANGGTAAVQQAAPFARTTADLVVKPSDSMPTANLTTPPEITSAPRPLLLYIPFHVSEPASHITDMIDCTFRMQPWRKRPTFEFDVLLAISGRSPAGNEHQLKRMLEDATADMQPRPRVFVEFKPLKSDRYVQDIEEEQKDADWVGGPNTAFYDAFLEGHIYSKYVRHYGLVQQLETDVCALKSGWLDDLVAPAVANPHILVSGATIKGDCIYIKTHDRCESNDEAPEHMRRHVNGNALYRIGADLATVLTQAKSAFGNAEPFDLSIYWAMSAMSIEHKLHSNPVYGNLASLVDTARLKDVNYYGGNITIVHVPRRLRSCTLRSVATRGYVGLPLTIVVVSGAPRPSLTRLIESLTRHQIDRYVLLATSEATFVQLSKTYPLRILPAYANSVERRASSSPAKIGDSGLKSGDAIVDPTTLKPEDASIKKDAALLYDEKRACEPWMRDGASPASLLYTIVARLIRMGYAPFLVDQHALAIRDYELALFQTPADGMYVTGKELKKLRTASNVSAWRPDLAYFPRSEMVASAADSLATLVDSDQPLLQHVPLKSFSPFEISDSGPFDDLSFPLVLRSQQLVRLSDVALPEFDKLVSRVPPHVHARCANYSIAVARSFDVQYGGVAGKVKQVVNAVALARANAVSCVVLPSLVFKRRSAATMLKLFNTTFLNKLAGDVRLVPSVANIDTNRATYIDLSAHHSRPRHIQSGVCGTNDSVCLSADVLSLLSAAAETGLSRDYVCARSTGIKQSDNAFVLRHQVDALSRAVKSQTNGRKVFLRGTWRHLPVDTWTGVSEITTLAHVRAVLHGGPAPPHSAQPFGEGDSIAFDAAWADVIESIICAGAKASLTVRIEGTTPTDPAFLTGTPHAASDLADFRAWLRRPDRPSLRGPVIVLPAAASCKAFTHAARLGLMLAHASQARHVVLPVVDPAWNVNTTALHTAFTSLLPPTVARLLHPRLTFDALFDDGNVSVNTNTGLATMYAPELTLVDRTRRAAASHTVLWTANSTDALHTSLRVGMREWDWLVVRNADIENASTEHAVRAAVAMSSDGKMNGLAYLRRVDAALASVCAAAGNDVF